MGGQRGGYTRYTSVYDKYNMYLHTYHIYSHSTHGFESCLGLPGSFNACLAEGIRDATLFHY